VVEANSDFGACLFDGDEIRDLSAPVIVEDNLHSRFEQASGGCATPSSAGLMLFGIPTTTSKASISRHLASLVILDFTSCTSGAGTFASKALFFFNTLRVLYSSTVWSRTKRLGVTTRTRRARSTKAVNIDTPVFPEPVGMTTMAGS